MNIRHHKKAKKFRDSIDVRSLNDVEKLSNEEFDNLMKQALS